MAIADKRASEAYAPPRGDGSNVTALFGHLARAPEHSQAYHEVVKERDALRALLDQAPGFIAVLDGPEHRYRFSNAANNRLLGRDDLVGKTLAEAFPDLVRQGIVETLDQVHASGKTWHADGLTFEVGAGGAPQQRIVNFVYQPIRGGEDGPVTGIFVEGHDVTQLYEAHARIQAQHVELIHVSRVSAMGTMASTVAHELNQPLTAILNYLSAASRIAGRDGGNPQLDNCLEAARDVAQRAGRILHLLREMTLSAIEISPIFEVDDAVRQAVELACASHPEMIATFDIEPGAIARVDRIQFQQVMLNLIRNAQEACGEGPCAVAIAVRADGAFVEVTIRDNGPGFAVDELPHVFEALVTTKARGMGVGLSVCRTIIETYGGRISAHNDARGGALVRFTIPAETDRRRATRQ